MSTSQEPRESTVLTVRTEIVALNIQNQKLSILVIKRAAPPFKGQLMLPGGFIRPEEGLVEAATRQLATEVTFPIGAIQIEQLAAYGRIDRDPRMRALSIAYLAVVPALSKPCAEEEASDAYWQVVETESRLRWAFDHAEIVSDGLERMRAKFEYTTLATRFCNPEFTIGELREVYEIMWGCNIDAGNFYRKVMASAGFVEPTGAKTKRGGGRPANLYRRGSKIALHPSIVRS